MAVTPGLQELDFRFEWEPNRGVRAPELGATWARLEIQAGPHSICRVEDVETGSTRRSIYGSLYPLAEWIAYNWWHLQANVRAAGSARTGSGEGRHQLPSRTRNRWFTHHNLRAAGEGQTWPDLALLPEGTLTWVVWNADPAPPAHQPVRFISQGHCVVRSDALATELARVVEAVLSRLTEEGIQDTELAKEWEAISNLTEEERDFCVATARLGLDPFSGDEDLAAALEAVARRVEPFLQEDFLNAVNVQNLSSSLRWLDEAGVKLERFGHRGSGPLDALQARISAHETPSAALPWAQGWSQAKHARQAASLRAEERMELDELVPVAEQPSPDRGLQALGGIAPHAGAGMVLGGSPAAQARRFVQARGLWHALYRRGEPRFLVVQTYTDRQRVERAFAAELLAPAEGVQGQLDGFGDVIADDQVERIAVHYGVSTQLIHHQIENQLGFDVADPY